ncbi:MAG: hypothetical protein ABIN35_04115 [candidate division WOR-3 bacterium]
MSSYVETRIYLNEKKRIMNILNNNLMKCERKISKISDKRKNEIQVKINDLAKKINSEIRYERSSIVMEQVEKNMRRNFHKLFTEIKKIENEENEIILNNNANITKIESDLNFGDIGNIFFNEVNVIKKELDEIKNEKDIYIQKEKLEKLKIKNDDIVNKYQNYLAMKGSNLKEEKVVSNISYAKNENLQLQQKKEKAKLIYEKIKNFTGSDENENQKILEEILKSDNKTRVDTLYTQLVYNFENIKKISVMNEILKEKLSEYRNNVMNIENKNQKYQILMRNLGNLLRKDLIDPNQYEKLEDEIEQFLYEEERKNKLKEKLPLFEKKVKEEGWIILDEKLFEKLVEGENVEIKKGEYVVKVSYSDGKIITKYVKRSTKRKDSVSDFEKKEDENNARKWCNLYKNILKEISLEEIMFEDLIVVEPEFDNIEYEVLIEENLKEKRQEEKKNIKSSFE